MWYFARFAENSGTLAAAFATLQALGQGLCTATGDTLRLFQPFALRGYPLKPLGQFPLPLSHLGQF